MTDTIDAVTADEVVDQRQLAEQLLAQAKEQGVDLVRPGGLLNQITKRVLETALEAEMSEHLGTGPDRPRPPTASTATRRGSRRCTWSPTPSSSTLHKPTTSRSAGMPLTPTTSCGTRPWSGRRA